MRIGVGLHRNAPDDWESALAFALEAERLGADSIWSGEAWGFDGATSLAYLASQTSTIRLGTSIMKIGARSPALTAGTAMALASMTNDRFVLGLGTSTPQIMEAWDGVAFDRPIRRSRELIEIIRLVALRKSNKAIGRALSISPRTVTTHLSNIYRKLAISSRGELADQASELLSAER